MNEFPIRQVCIPKNGSEEGSTFRVDSEEQSGSKEKLWCVNQETSVELASFDDKPAILTKFFPESNEQLVHGSDLLLERDANYPSQEIRRVRQHTLDAVLKVLGGLDARR